MLTGACLCGKLRYEIDGKPRFMYQCFCGTLKDDPGIRPSYYASVASKAAWVDISDEQPQFSEYPDPAAIRDLMKSS